MPLIKKGILVEGPDGMHQVRTYYDNERAPNRYSELKNRRASDRIRKMREFMEFRRRTAPAEKGYTWSIGYNHCCGRYSPEGRYCPFSGSSLNRDKKLKYDKDLETGEGITIALAYKAAKKYYRRGWELPGPVADYIKQQDPDSKARFRNWLSEAPDLSENGICLPIYKLSPRSRGKIKDKATAFFRACPRERVFCTLTFLAPVDDLSGVAILNKFLTALRKQLSGLQYLWVAERQENGNIHFHVILNKRIAIRKYNALWVLQQYNAGLRGQTKYGEPVSMQEIEDRYKDGSIHKVFNPVDVKRVRSIAGLSAYLTKYITKQKDTYFSCAPWHCSRGVSRLFTRATVGPSAFRYMMSLNNCKLDKSTGEVFMPTVVRPKGAGAFCIVVYVNKKDAPLCYLKEMETINRWLIRGQVVDRGHLDTIEGFDKYVKYFCQN
jgi:hypothetical protein